MFVILFDSGYTPCSFSVDVWFKVFFDRHFSNFLPLLSLDNDLRSIVVFTCLLVFTIDCLGALVL